MPPFLVACRSLVLDVEESVEAAVLFFQAHLLVYLTIIVIMVTTIIVIIIQQIASDHLSVIELVAHDTVALRVESCKSRRVIRDFLERRSVDLFVLSARLETTLQERPTQGTARELPSP